MWCALWNGKCLCWQEVARRPCTEMWVDSKEARGTPNLEKEDVAEDDLLRLDDFPIQLEVALWKLPLGPQVLV